MHTNSWGVPSIVRSENENSIPTTHYMAIEQMPDKNEFFVSYDWGFWSFKEGRYIYGRKVTVKA